MSKSTDDSDDDDYDPHEHRNLAKPTNSWESFVHLIKCALGTGILAMPQGFANVGMVVGVLGNVIGGIIVTHCLHLVVRSSYLQCKRKRVPLLLYSEAFQVALEHGPQKFRRFGKCASLLVDISLVTFQLGVCCVYIIYIASSLKKLVDPAYEMSITIHMFIVLGPLIMINLIPNLKILAPFSLVANIMIFLGLAAVVYFAFTADRPDNSDIKLVGPYLEIPLFFGTVLFALTAVGVVIAVELNMKEPMKFRGWFGVFNLSMACIVGIYVFMGIIGYNFCRDKCADSITLNTPQDVWLAKLVVVVYAIAIFISYALHCYVPVQIVFDHITKKLGPDASNAKLLAYNYALRIALCLLTFGLALAIPRLGLFISLFGALCIPALGMFFPAIMEALETRSKLLWTKDICICLVGLLAMITGCYSAIKSIIMSFVE